jgi:hypothetical protein
MKSRKKRSILVAHETWQVKRISWEQELGLARGRKALVFQGIEILREIFN